MTALLRLLLAAIPNALIAILASVATEAFVRDVIEDVLVFGIKKLTANSISTIDDEIATRFYIALGRNADGSRKAP